MTQQPSSPSKKSPAKAGPQPLNRPGNDAAASGPSPQAKAALQLRPLGVSNGISNVAQKIVLYGPGGVGKTELASLLLGVGVKPIFLDLDEGSCFLDVARVDPTPQIFEEVGLAVQLLSKMDHCGAIVVDSFTKAEELAIAYTLRTVPHEKGHIVSSIEGYGWGKGYVHVYESFLRLLQALDAAARGGKHIIAVCHDCTATVPNPGGEDWIRYEPRLQSPPSGRGSIRHRVKEWCDHLLYIGFDTFVGTDGKASGSGTRTIYPIELPTHWAKSRLLSEQVEYVKGSSEIWKRLFSKR